MNLTLSKAFKIMQVMNMVSMMQMLGIFFNIHQNLNENWNGLLQKLLLNHLKRKSNHCVKHVGLKDTQHLQI